MKAKKALHLAELYVIEVDEHHAELHKQLLERIGELQQQLSERIAKLERSLHQFPVQAEPKIQVKDFGPPKQVIPQQPHEFAPVHPKMKPFCKMVREEMDTIERAVDTGTTPPTGQK